MVHSACLRIGTAGLLGLWVLAGCDDTDYDDIPVVEAGGYTYQLSVHNEDPAVRQVWLRSEIAPGTWDWVLLDVLDWYESGLWYYDAIPGIPHELVVADVHGHETDWAPLGFLSEPSPYPHLFTFLVVNGRLR